MLGALSTLEALQDLVLARGVAELVVAVGHVGLVALELAHPHHALRLDVLDEGLVCEQLGGADGGCAPALPAREALVGEGPLEVLLDTPQPILAAGTLGDGTGELLARKELFALAQRTDTLESEAERGSGAHGRVIGRAASFLSLDPLVMG